MLLFRLSPYYASWNLVSGLGLLSPDLLVLKEVKTCLCLCFGLDCFQNFSFQNLSWLDLSALTSETGFTVQKVSIHGVMWKISKGHTLSLLILDPCSQQISHCQLFAATANLTVKINYDTNYVTNSVTRSQQMSIICCNCQSDSQSQCSIACSCRKHGIHCMSVCRGCHGVQLKLRKLGNK